MKKNEKFWVLFSLIVGLIAVVSFIIDKLLVFSNSQLIVLSPKQIILISLGMVVLISGVIIQQKFLFSKYSDKYFKKIIEFFVALVASIIVYVVTVIFSPPTYDFLSKRFIAVAGVIVILFLYNYRKAKESISVLVVLIFFFFVFDFSNEFVSNVIIKKDNIINLQKDTISDKNLKIFQMAEMLVLKNQLLEKKLLREGTLVEQLKRGKTVFNLRKGEETVWLSFPDGYFNYYTSSEFYNHVLKFSDGTSYRNSKDLVIPQKNNVKFKIIALDDEVVTITITN